MIEAVFYKNSNGIYTGFQIKGHAGLDRYGKDILCAAVSTLSISTINSIETFTDDIFESGSKEGFLYLKFKSRASEKAILLLNSLHLGLQNLSEDYNKKWKKYIIVKVKEV